MKISSLQLTAVLVVLFAIDAVAATHYVDLNSLSPTPPYTNWATAATNIQDAIDAAGPGEQILVTNGVYQSGGRVVYGALTNRVVVNKALTLQSVNGAAVTGIAGYGKFSDNAVRCVYLTNGAILVGFTLTNGSTRSVGWPNPTAENCGGGVWCESISAVISNCVLAGNTAEVYGGGAYGGTLYNCTLTNNGGGSGGGAALCVLSNCMVASNSINGVGGGLLASTGYNCTITRNAGQAGGGARDCALYQCTLTTNYSDSGGGAFGGKLYNCSIMGNVVWYEGGGVGFCTASNCTLIGNLTSVAAGGNLDASGGGAYNSTLINCTLAGNQAVNNVGDTRQVLGGGAAGGALTNCVLFQNTANWPYGGGGGAYNATLNNCTVVGNSTYAHGGGTYNCTVNNSIVRFNGANYNGGSLNYCCTTPVPGVNGNIGTDPLLVNQAVGDLRLQASSPCINSGNNAANAASSDRDGNPRVRGGTVDIGAYEFQSPSSVLSYAWAQQYGLPTNGSADFTDPDGDGMNNWQEWIAGTIPTDALSLLRMFSPSNNAPGLKVSWQSVSGKTYFLLRGTNLAAQPTLAPLQSNLTGQAGTTIYTDTSATNPGPYFYRVGVQ